MSFTLELFDTPEMSTVLSECRRVLKPTGYLGIVSLDKWNENQSIIRMYGWIHDKFPAYVDCRPIPVRKVLKSSGFQVEEEIQMTMWGLPVSVARAQIS